MYCILLDGSRSVTVIPVVNCYWMLQFSCGHVLQALTVSKTIVLVYVTSMKFLLCQQLFICYSNINPCYIFATVVLSYYSGKDIAFLSIYLIFMMVASVLIMVYCNGLWRVSGYWLPSTALRIQAVNCDANSSSKTHLLSNCDKLIRLLFAQGDDTLLILRLRGCFPCWNRKWLNHYHIRRNCLESGLTGLSNHVV